MLIAPFASKRGDLTLFRFYPIGFSVQGVRRNTQVVISLLHSSSRYLDKTLSAMRSLSGQVTKKNPFVPIRAYNILFVVRPLGVMSEYMAKCEQRELSVGCDEEALRSRTSEEPVVSLQDRANNSKVTYCHHLCRVSTYTIPARFMNEPCLEICWLN